MPPYFTPIRFETTEPSPSYMGFIT